MTVGILSLSHPGGSSNEHFTAIVSFCGDDGGGRRGDCTCCGVEMGGTIRGDIDLWVLEKMVMYWNIDWKDWLENFGEFSEHKKIEN